MKVLLCCIVRLEHDYIKEYIDYYIKLGVDYFVVYDNGYNDEPTFDAVLSEYIDKGILEIVDFRNRQCCQITAYNDCYKRYNNDYDWLMFFDCDEFLSLKVHEDIKAYLSDEMFNDFQVISVNWRVYGDNGYLYKTSNEVLNRFTTPSDTPFFYNNFTKAIVRGGREFVVFSKTEHVPMMSVHLNFCSENGVSQNENFKLPYIVHHKCECACLNHYITKSLEEYLAKLKRGYPCNITDYSCGANFKKRINDYFLLNDITDEKREYLKENYNILLPVGKEYERYLKDKERNRDYNAELM